LQLHTFQSLEGLARLTDSQNPVQNPEFSSENRTASCHHVAIIIVASYSSHAEHTQNMCNGQVVPICGSQNTCCNHIVGHIVSMLILRGVAGKAVDRILWYVALTESSWRLIGKTSDKQTHLA